MQQSSHWISTWRVTIFCPIGRETLAAASRGDVAALERDVLAGPILRYLARSPHFGNFGKYVGVCETSLGVELFTPTSSASPTLGHTEQRTHSPTAAVSAYAAGDLKSADLDALVAELAGLHPWEVPVIEVTSVRLFARKGAGTRPHETERL